MAELYAKPFETIETGYNPQQPQGGGQPSEADEYLSSLPPEERQAAIQRLNAPLTGEELATLASSGQKMPTLAEFAEIEKFHKSHEVSFIDGLGKIAEGGEQFMTDITKAFGAILDKPTDVASKMPATAVEAFAQGTRNFYGMLAQSSNTDSTLFKVKDFLNGTGTIEDRYNQYIQALKFNKDSAELAEGKQTMVMDADMINHEVTQAMAYIADPTLFIPFGKVASTGLRAVGLGEKLAMAGARSAAIKNGIIGNTLKWGVGQPLEFLGGAVRNTIDYGLEKAGSAFEATTGVGAKEFAQTARMSGIGFSASAVAGHAVPYASTISDAYIVGSSARGFGEAITLVGETMKNNPFGRGVRSWAAESLKQAEKNGVALSPHAKGLLKVLDAVDPLFAYGWNAVETAAEGAYIGGGLGYLGGGQEGMYSGIGAGIAMGAVGGTAGKVVADVTGGTNVARRAIQAKMTIEGHKVLKPEKAMFFEAMQKTAEARGQDVDLVNSVIIGIDEVAPNFEFHALTPEQFVNEAKQKGYDPTTGKFKEVSALNSEFGGDRASKSKAISILRSIGGDFVGDRTAFLDALKKASAKDSANPNKPASNIPLALRKYTDVAKTFEKLTKTQQEAVLKEIDGQGAIAKELGGSTKLRDHYDTLTWAEGWTDQLVKKFETDREGARKDITDMLAQETGKDGKLNRKGRALADKLRAEGFLDRDNKLLRERNLLQADMTASEFAFSKGAVIGRESDGKTHMYINLNSMGDETFPHELFHTIMRESPMKKHFTDSLISKLLGTVDKDGKLVRPAEVNINQVQKFFKKYIDLTHRNSDGTLDAQASEAKFKLVQEALTEYQNAGTNKQISDKARGLLENYSEEFGAYYFSHWLMGRNRNTLFFGGELKGIEGLVERTKDSFMDFWQSKISKANPEFDFSKGLNESFDRSKGLGRIGAIDYYMRDMVRAASNANREVFRPDAMTLDNLKDFERSNGLRNLTTVDGNRRLNPREQVTQNIRLGKEAFKILSGVDKAMRTSKDVIDENGKQVITGRLSETELDALVKGGIVPRAWADKVNQGYAMLDGTISNVFSAGYLGKTEQTTDASYPRLTGKDVAFKNRKAVLFDVETKVKADGTFYTLFHTLDLAVIEQEANRLFQNTDYRALFDGDRAVMEADFFRYLSNASKASTDPKKLDSAVLLEKGDGLGAARRDVLHQMGRMALQTGDAYKHQPIAVIPEGFRHSVTTFNIDGMTMPRVETGTRIDIDMKNAHKFIRENWQPDEMKQEKTPSGVLMTHESGFKFSNLNGKTTAYTSAGRKIGAFDSIKSATNAAKIEYNKVYNNIDKGVRDSVIEQDKNATKFQPLDENERAEAIRLGDVFALQSMRDFVGNRTLLRQTREEHIYQRALESIENPEQLLAYAEQKAQNSLNIKSKYDAMFKELEKRQASYNSVKDNNFKIHDQQLGVLRKKHGVVDTFEEWKGTSEKYNPPSYSDKDGILEYYKTKEERKTYDMSAFYRYEQDAKIAWDKYFADPAHAKEMQRYESVKETSSKEWTDLLTFEESLTQFKKANAEAMNDPIVSYLDTLGQYSTAETTRAEKATMFAKSVEANAKQKDYSGLLEAMFADEYDSQIQTGKPFVAVTTHGTGNVELMLARLFAADKLGSHYDIPSSRMGSFSAGSQNTSRAYARKPQVVDRSPAARFKRLTSFLNEKGMTDKTTEQYKLTQHFIDLYRGHLKTLGYDEATVEYTWRGFLHEQNPFNTSFELERFPQEVVDAWRKLVKKDNENLPPSAPDRQMQLRKVIRMDNPYVVVDPRSYEEHYISPHMKRAIAAGHDGIIFKRFADGGQPDNVYVVFKDYMKDNIKVIDTSFDDVQVPRGNDDTGRVLKGGKELNLAFQPTDEAEGGRVYDFNSPKFKSSFIGKYAEQNPDRVKGINLQFMKRADGSHRIRLTDNSKKGESADIGHITANINGDTATLSSHINEDYRGKKLAYVVYSEMAERLRAMGVTAVDGTIVNPDGVPIKVREKIIGDTRDLYSGRRINYVEGANRIRDKQEIVGSMGGVDVTNTLYKQARYQPAEYQGGDDYYKPKKNKFESKDEQGFLVRSATIKNSDGTMSDNPQRIDWFDIGHFGGRETKELTKWENQNSGLWMRTKTEGVVTKNPVAEFGDASYTHNQWLNEKPYGKNKTPSLGRYENPRFDSNGKLVERGKISINSSYDSPVESMADARKIKSDLAKKLGFNEEDYDAYLFRANPETKQSMGYGAKDELPIKFQPTEGEQGGRTYTDDQFNKEFIGKFASENPEIANKFFIRIKENDGGTLEDWDYKMVIYDKDTKKAVARTKWQMFENDDGIFEDAAADVEILNDAYKGMKLSHLMQSERLERSRFLGAEKVRSQITNEEGIPIKNYAKTIGADKGEITSSFADRFNEDGLTKYIPATMENFKQEMDLSKAHADGTWKPTVYYRADLDPKAWYQPAESEKAPVNWVKNNFYTEGYNSEIIWMTPERFLKLAYPLNLTDKEEVSKMRSKVNKIKKTLQEKGSDMDMPFFSMKRNKDGELQVSGHEGRHRATALQELYGDKLIPVQLAMSEILKAENIGDDDWAYGKGGAKLKPESERKKGTVSKEFKSLEEKPFLNEKGTGRFQPSEYTEFKSEQSPMGRIMRNAKGYVITMANNKFRVYNPAKAIIGVYGSEEEAKKRIYKEIPKQ